MATLGNKGWYVIDSRHRIQPDLILEGPFECLRDAQDAADDYDESMIGVIAAYGIPDANGFLITLLEADK